VRIDSARVVLPSRRVSNDDLLGLIRSHSEGLFAGDLDGALARIASLLRRSGAEWRHWLDAEETPIGLVSQAVEAALGDAGCERDEVELLVYTGVDRGFLDPANAYFVAQALGFDKVECFDVVDACNGWSRALQLTYALFGAGLYRRVLLVAGEFPMFDGGAVYPDLFTLRTLEEVPRSFAAYTLGEAAAAAVVSCDPGRLWEFRFSSRPDLAHLCTVPLPGYQRYARDPEQAAANGVGRFTSNGGKMFSIARREVASLLRELTVPLEDVTAIFPHAATARDWEEGREALGIEPPLYNIYPRFGNLAAASIPAGIALAAAEERIHRGDRLLCLTGSAGMSFAAYSFVY
jgi:3-oxoacyl-[acyl-carrier-protein] synthase III